jgi:hypothetical protein
MNEDNQLYGLAFDCPYLDRKDNCPMLEVEHLTFGEKYLWIKNLSQDEKQKLIEKHKSCSKNRV